jgi:hypothetical protein
MEGGAVYLRSEICAARRTARQPRVVLCSPHRTIYQNALWPVRTADELEEFKPNRGGIYSCSTRVFGRPTGQGIDNLVPKREREAASCQPDGGVSRSLPSTLLPAKDFRCRTCASDSGGRLRSSIPTIERPALHRTERHKNWSQQENRAAYNPRRSERHIVEILDLDGAINWENTVLPRFINHCWHPLTRRSSTRKFKSRQLKNQPNFPSVRRLPASPYALAGQL